MIHPFDPVRAKRWRDDALEDLPAVTQVARTSTSSLPTVMKLALRLATLHRVHGDDAAIGPELRLAVEAGVAVFLCAPRPGEAVTFPLGGETVTARADITPDQAHGGRWELAFFGALVLRDEALLRALCDVPIDVVLRSPTKGTRHHELWLRALHHLGKTGEIDQKLLLESLHETEPSRLPADLVDLVLYLRVPPLELLHHLGRGREAQFNQTLEKALDYHRRYWSKPERANDAEGFVSWVLSGIVALARQRGLTVPVESGYLVSLPG